MKLRYTLGCAILLWGLHSDLMWFALPMIGVLEGRHFVNRRWALTQKDFYQIADLTSVGFVLLLIFLFLNRAEYHFITTLVRWLPILFFPLVTVLAYSTTERMSLDILFYSLRRQKQPVRQSWDMEYLLFGMCLVAAGTNRDAAVYFYPVASLLVFLAMLPLRSNRYALNLWVLLICGVFLAGIFVHTGVRESHLELKKRSQAWLANWIQQRTNPLRTQTAIGHVGRLKASDAILFRVTAPVGAPVPRLLQEASYDLPTASSWTVMNPGFDEVPHADDFRWELAQAGAEDPALTIYLEFQRSTGLVPLPGGVTEIDQLPATGIRRNYYGAVQGLELIPSPGFEVRFRPGEDRNGPPLLTDTFVTIKYKDLIGRIVERENLSAADPLGSLEHFYRDFRYSLYQEASVAEPIEHFLLERKAGHCEYFATTTVLLLREMGIPARYVVGYAVQEYDSLLEMFVVRQRHAHAWAIAYLDGRWQVVDTTPSVWLEEEGAEATLLQPVLDLITNSSFMFTIWWNKQKLEDYQWHLVTFGLLLALFLAFRIYRSEPVILETERRALGGSSAHPGMNSPLYDLSDALADQGFERPGAEPLDRWYQRIGLARLLPLVSLHNRWRFDPKGISPSMQGKLTDQVQKEIDNLSPPASTRR